jgi:hypothetical protein
VQNSPRTFPRRSSVLVGARILSFARAIGLTEYSGQQNTWRLAHVGRGSSLGPTVHLTLYTSIELILCVEALMRVPIIEALDGAEGAAR